MRFGVVGHMTIHGETIDTPHGETIPGTAYYSTTVTNPTAALLRETRQNHILSIPRKSAAVCLNGAQGFAPQQ
jgi:hypothetical protein